MKGGAAAWTPEALAGALLEWYDVHGRRLPWRISPADRAKGARPDPYAVWLSEAMAQQTTLAAVKPYYARFLEKWPTAQALAAAPRDEVLREWAGLGYYARARKLHECAQILAARGGFPKTEAELLELPGVGPYTAAAIAAIVYDAPAVVVDGNVERVMARLFAIEAPLPEGKPLLRAAAARLTPQKRPGDYAQAVMDLGATICSPRSPACAICPWVEPCEGRRRGLAAELPRKSAKAARPERKGAAYVAIREDGLILVEIRPDKGLLGGMAGFPGSEWTPEGGAGTPPLDLAWRPAGVVRHVFTHFGLDLEIMAARAPLKGPAPRRGAWARPEEAALPGVMLKALNLARKALEEQA